MMRSLRRLLFGLFIAGFASPVMAQGVIPVALQQEVNINGQPLAGALLYTFVVGTVSTQQSTFQDSGLTITNPWPLVADQTGRIPMFYMANGATHVRLTDSTGLVQFDYPSMLVIGASGGSSGGGSVDPTTIMATGDMKVRYGIGAISGFVRTNGLNIGSAVSGATERANADTQNLFIYLYNTDPNLTVSGGRTGNALNDYNSNKTITLPDWRDRAIAGLGDMGNTDIGLLTASWFGAADNVLGNAGGAQNNSLNTLTQLPMFTPSVAAYNLTYGIQGGYYVAGAPVTVSAADGVNNGGLNTVPIGGTIIFNSIGSGSPTPFTTVQPTRLTTIYIKL